MSVEPVPGHALGCRTNAHRHGWNGRICERAASWSCGIDQEFREKYCENGIPRCFHLHIFDEADPYLVIPDSGVGWVLESDPHAFDDQILLVWAPDAQEPHGIAAGKPSTSFMAGVYRIEAAERLEHRNHVEWKIRPYTDGWVFLGTLEVPAPRFIHLEGPYIKQVERPAVDRLFEVALETGTQIDEDWTLEDRARLEHFSAHLGEWFAIAQEKAPLLQQPRSRAILTPARRGRDLVPGTEHAVEPRSAAPRPSDGEEPADAPREVQPQVVETPAKPFVLLEEKARERIVELYGEELANALRIAALTKPIVLLRGEPGVGKSRLAANLLDDPAHERTLIVPVAAHWTNRGDLLGRIHPAKGLFEPTELATFLHQAQLAWDAGDQRARVVVLDDIDNSPPEAWMAEILSRLHFQPGQRRDRTIELGSVMVRGWPRNAQACIYLTPAVRFVGTIDVERSARPLSLRVLDRSAVVNVALGQRAALRSAGLEPTPKQLQAISELSQISRRRGIGFTLRTARALATCMERLEELATDAWGALDLVLRQEILEKLALDGAAPIEPQLALELGAWAERYGSKLRECARTIEALRAELSAPQAELQAERP